MRLTAQLDINILKKESWFRQSLHLFPPECEPQYTAKPRIWLKQLTDIGICLLTKRRSRTCTYGQQILGLQWVRPVETPLMNPFPVALNSEP
jgi:hypothetical protein